MWEPWDGLVRDFVRHLKGTNRSESTQRIYRRAAEGLVGFLQESGQLVTPDGLTRRHIEDYMAHLIQTRSASTANVVYRALQQFIKWLQDEEEIDRSPMERMRPPIVPEKPVPVLTEIQLRTLLQGSKGCWGSRRRSARRHSRTRDRSAEDGAAGGPAPSRQGHPPTAARHAAGDEAGHGACARDERRPP